MNLPKELGAAFSAGAFGGLVNGLCVWLFGRLGISAALGVAIAPGLSPAMLYPRIVWGGLWAFLFLLGWPPGGGWKKGLILSLGPTLVQLLYIFPVKAGPGYAGPQAGTSDPAFGDLLQRSLGHGRGGLVPAFRTAGLKRPPEDEDKTMAFPINRPRRLRATPRPSGGWSGRPTCARTILSTPSSSWRARASGSPSPAWPDSSTSPRTWP